LDPEKGKQRRNFLKALISLGVLATIGSLASSFRLLGFVPASTGQTATTATPAWPRVKIANASSLTSTPLRFNYPLVDTPNVLVKVGKKVDGGVGPDSDILAYSAVCQHLGCIYAVVQPGGSPPCKPSFTASEFEGYCCCHGGQYLLEHGAQVVPGTPPPRPVPPVVLEYDGSTGDIYAVGMGPPTIFGHGPAGTTDPGLLLTYDLEGGEVVGPATIFFGA
jgi:arsenite oxidase small subunit